MKALPKHIRSAATDYIIDFFLEKGWIYSILIGGLIIISFFLSRNSIVPALAFSIIPLAIVGVFILLKYSLQGFYALFALQFLLVVANMFVDIKLGVSTLLLCLIAVGLLPLRNIYERIDYSPGKNIMVWLFLFWGIFCFLQLANPNNVQAAWNAAITQYWVYPIICAFLVPITVRNFKGIYVLLFIWSVFILFAAAKGYWQKNHGFSEKELYFLYELGGSITHIIWSGVRYFSCFSDATNFGVHMAMGMITFILASVYTKNFYLKVYFLIVTLAAIYGMGISGTRGAIAVPMGGIALYIVLSRNWKAVLIGVVALVSLFVFFKFTYIGHSNPYIRRMRTAFHPTSDLSYQVRIVNRENMENLMRTKPIGYGLGLSKSERYSPKQTMPYPPDSWLVSVWVESGFTGLILYCTIHALLFAWCSWIIMFKIMHKRLKGILTAWLCTCAGFFISTFASDVMQYPNTIIVYTGFALCIAGPLIDRSLKENHS